MKNLNLTEFMMIKLKLFKLKISCWKSMRFFVCIKCKEKNKILREKPYQNILFLKLPLFLSILSFFTPFALNLQKALKKQRLCICIPYWPDHLEAFIYLQKRDISRQLSKNQNCVLNWNQLILWDCNYCQFLNRTKTL